MSTYDRIIVTVTESWKKDTFKDRYGNRSRCVYGYVETLL